MYFVYILQNKVIDKFYIGFTTNIERRLADHNKLGHKTKYTRKQRGEWQLTYVEEFKEKSTALRREKQIKAMKSKFYIKNLIEQSRL